MNTLFLVTGSNGAIGSAYLEELVRHNQTTVAIARGHHRHDWPCKQTFDLLNKEDCETCIRHLDLTRVSRVVLIHTVGKFHFELTPGEMSEEIWQSNLTTFVNIADPLLARASTEGIQVKLVAFGSPSDFYHVPFWRMFTAAKDSIREYIKKAVFRSRDMQGLFVNISSTRTANEEKLRPFADTSTWLTPEEVVQGSIAEIRKSGGTGYREIQIIRPDPNFNNYYADIDTIRKKWYREMFGREGETP